jgi:thioester reductase-like protein
VNEFLPAFLKGCIQLGSFPHLDTKVEMVPIDFAARVAVAIAQDNSTIGKVFHVNHPRAITALEFAEEMRRMGYRLRTVPWDAWKHELLGSGNSLQQNALYPFISFIAGLEEHQTGMPEMTMRNVLGVINGKGLNCPRQETLLQRYFRFFWDSRFIEPPAGYGLMPGHTAPGASLAGQAAP